MQVRARVWMAVVLLMAVVACKKSSPGGPTGPALTAITVEPDHLILDVDLDSPTTQTFTATGQYEDGTTADVTAEVTWSRDSDSFGDFQGSTLPIPGQLSDMAFGATVEARLNGVKGNTFFTLVAHPPTEPLFILPYQDAGGPVTQDVSFLAPAWTSADVFFLVDATGSMGGEIANLQSSFSGSIAAGIRAEIADTQFGVGAVEDFPIDPYGDPACGAQLVPDQPFKLFASIGDSLPAAQSALSGLAPAGTPIGCGVDLPESHIEALYQVATGEGLNAPSPTFVPPNTAGVGGVDFRESVPPVVVLATDAMSHAPGEATTCADNGASADYAGAVAAVAHTRAEAKAALASICARVMGVASDPGTTDPTCSSQADLLDFATGSGARVAPAVWDVPGRPAGCATGQCCTGINQAGQTPDGDGLCPLVFATDASGTGLGGGITDGFTKLMRYAGVDVSPAVQGETDSFAGVTLPGGATSADFLQTLAPSAFVAPMPPPTLPDPTSDASGFHGVVPGTQLTFAVSAYNDLLAESAEPQLFQAHIEVLGGICTTLDTRDILILVPVQ